MTLRKHALANGSPLSVQAPATALSSSCYGHICKVITSHFVGLAGCWSWPHALSKAVQTLPAQRPSLLGVGVSELLPSGLSLIRGEARARLEYLPQPFRTTAPWARFSL